MFQLTTQLVAAICPDSLNKLCDFKSWCMTRNFKNLACQYQGITVPALSVFRGCNAPFFPLFEHTVLTDFTIYTKFIKDNNVLLTVNI